MSRRPDIPTDTVLLFGSWAPQHLYMYFLGFCFCLHFFFLVTDIAMSAVSNWLPSRTVHTFCFVTPRNDPVGACFKAGLGPPAMKAMFNLTQPYAHYPSVVEIQLYLSTYS